MLAQWAKDNKFVESWLKSWALVNLDNNFFLDNNYHKFKEDLN